MKKSFAIPFILSSNNGTKDEIIGTDTGQGNKPPYAMSFAEWQQSGFWYAYDNEGLGGNQDNAPDDFEYENWWLDAMDSGYEGFTQADWEALNPGYPWPF